MFVLGPYAVLSAEYSPCELLHSPNVSISCAFLIHQLSFIVLAGQFVGLILLREGLDE